MSNSTHKAEVFQVDRVETHPNADRLDVVHFAGFTTVTQRNDFSPGDLAVFIPPDSVVDCRREDFAFLLPRARSDGTARIKAITLRGVKSFGLVVHAPGGSSPGDDVASLLGIQHYEPPIPGEGGGRKGLFLGGENEDDGPDTQAPKYDLESFRRYAKEVFSPGEPVIATEKVDGTSCRVVFHDGRLYVGSRTNWKKEFPDYSHLSLASLTAKGLSPEAAQEILDRLHSKPRQRNLWWDVLRRTPALERFCVGHPGVVVCGEVYGNVNCIKYGLPEGNRFAAFDLLKGGEWVDPLPAREEARDLAWAPLLTPSLTETAWAYDFDTLCELAEGPTTITDASSGVIREGLVVQSLNERVHPKLGRAKLKLVSAAFLEKYR